MKNDAYQCWCIAKIHSWADYLFMYDCEGMHKREAQSTLSKSTRQAIHPPGRTFPFSVWICGARS